MKPFQIALTTALLVCASSAGAGTFRLTSANTWRFQSQQVGHTGAGALAEARYDGTLDSNDNSWTIVAHLHSSFGGPYGGDANRGAGISEGMIIKCGQGCGGQADLPNCVNGQAVSYLSKASVAIYHQFSPEIHEKTGSASTTSCSNTSQCDISTGGTREETGTTTSGDPEGCCYSRCSPILINLGGDSFHLTGPESPVRFDIDADGDADAISWTAADADEAFLALDRNHNGLIDHGRELFGVAAEQPPSPDPNGFIALSVFDDPRNGGNGDGMISALDQVFPDLVLWTDNDRNGVSEPWELSPLLDRGVVSIRLDYRLAERSDRFGNSFRWSSTAYRQDGRPLSAVDVIFVTTQD